MAINKSVQTEGKVKGILSNLIIGSANGAVSQNEICYIQLGKEHLLGEVIKIIGEDIYIQCYESTRGMTVDSTISYSGHMLQVQLGPGLLSKTYDGLQNDLNKMEDLFIQRGSTTSPLDENSKWEFFPLANVGQRVKQGDWLGYVIEKGIEHKIMAPFTLEGIANIEWIAENGQFHLEDIVCKLIDEEGKSWPVTLVQKWPIKVALKAYAEKVRPFKMLPTGVRCIDSLTPIMEGGTGFIPGPFGTGKTVLQHAISKQAEADIILFAACGERANEIVEVFTEFPKLIDPNTGQQLMERTIIIANTSNMPVAAREASVYTAMTIAEYYRQMGLKVLLLADSTSRWAQALREISNRLEELPGPDAFPMDLTAVIANFYARAGYVHLHNGHTGSITFLGTVSPSGGNLKEPVTEATKKSARCFYALSQKRADQKRYPAVDPVESYSKYLEYPEVVQYLRETMGEEWLNQMAIAKNALIRGREVFDQINILGDDGVPLDFHVQFWKAEVIDYAILQQDAFDEIDAMTPLGRQKYMMDLIMQIYQMNFQFDHFEAVSTFFKKIIDMLKQLNYKPFQSEIFEAEFTSIMQLLDQHKHL
jgi:V/A-type H+-transporting ATPase subunit A